MPMKLQEALETLRLHAQDYAAPRDLRDAVGAVTDYFDHHPVVSAEAFFAALQTARDRMNQRDQDDHTQSN
jgi:hypothetical protein